MTNIAHWETIYNEESGLKNEDNRNGYDTERYDYIFPRKIFYI